MKKATKFLSLCLLALISTVIPVSAQTAILVWDQNIEPDVIGYKVYYRTGTPTFPFDGVGLSEGASPIAVDGSTTTSLAIDLPDDGKVYYFTATAVNGAGDESSVSNIVASEWIPYLIAPNNDTVIDSSTTTLMWDLPPENFNVSFDLFYGTDKNLDDNAMSVTGHGRSNSKWPQFELGIVFLMAFLMPMLIAARPGRAKNAWHPVRLGFCIGIFVLQVSCGGGGGSDSGVVVGTDIPGTPESSTVTPAPAELLPIDVGTDITSTSEPSIEAPAPTESLPVDVGIDIPITTVPSTDTTIPTDPLFADVITDIYDTQYQLTDLKPDTQYYWKVVAVDNWGNTYESLTKTFRTPTN